MCAEVRDKSRLKQILYNRDPQTPNSKECLNIMLRVMKIGLQLFAHFCFYLCLTLQTLANVVDFTIFLAKKDEINHFSYLSLISWGRVS